MSERENGNTYLKCIVLLRKIEFCRTTQTYRSTIERFTSRRSSAPPPSTSQLKHTKGRSDCSPTMRGKEANMPMTHRRRSAIIFLLDHQRRRIQSASVSQSWMRIIPKRMRTTPCLNLRRLLSEGQKLQEESLDDIAT